MATKTTAELIAKTHDDAVSIVEDFDHLKSVSEKAETSPVDLRHGSVILRRWLIEGLLKRVASPRIGRVNVSAIDNNPVYRSSRNGAIESFVSGGAIVHGIYLAAGMSSRGARAAELTDYHPDIAIDLRLETFQRQGVIFVDREWITREQVIKFVANVAHGVHSGQPKEKWELLLAGFQQCVSVRLIDGPEGENMPSIEWSVENTAGQLDPKEYDPSRVNGVLLELLATIHFLITSPDIHRLVTEIRTKLRTG